MKITFLFSGQGSQYRGMGKKLYDENPVFKGSIENSHALIEKILHRSLIDELYHKKGEKFDDLLITHPAIVAMEIAMDKVLKNEGIQPDMVSGNSLGEFAAAYSAGVWGEETAIVAAIEQAKSIVTYAPQGGMMAVLNRKRHDLQSIYEKHNIYLASDNFDKHFTVSGIPEHLDNLEKELTNEGIHYLRLDVNHPFHSPLVNDAFAPFDYYMALSEDLCPPKCTFISGVDGAILNTLATDHFKNAVSQYTNFEKSVETMESIGPCFYIDLGPSGTSATFVKYNLPKSSKSQSMQVMSAFGREADQLRLIKKRLACL